MGAEFCAKPPLTWRRDTHGNSKPDSARQQEANQAGYAKQEKGDDGPIKRTKTGLLALACRNEGRLDVSTAFPGYFKR